MNSNPQKINDIAGTFQALAQSPIYDATAAVTTICAVLIVLFTMYLYFDTAWTNVSVNHGWLWVKCHFVYMLSLIMLFEGKYSAFCSSTVI
jgi:hypothetical protein